VVPATAFSKTPYFDFPPACFALHFWQVKTLAWLYTGPPPSPHFLPSEDGSGFFMALIWPYQSEELALSLSISSASPSEVRRKLPEPGGFSSLLVASRQCGPFAGVPAPRFL
jgi:hypothetical protein